VPVLSKSAIASGEVVSAADGEAVFALRTGTKLDVERGTELAMVVAGETEEVRLDRGGVTSHVVKLKGAGRFLVRTADAEVEVRGTVFRVSRVAEEGCGSGTGGEPRSGERTRVHVTEGRVVVRAAAGGVTLDPGGDWASPCAPTAEAAASIPALLVTPPSPVAAPSPLVPAPSVLPGPSGLSGLPDPLYRPNPPGPAAARAAGPRDPVASRAASTVPDAPPAGAALVVTSTPAAPEPDPSSSAARSDLTVQNALFAEAMSAKSRGETRRAVASLDALLDRYPRSPLREAAEAQRMNLAAAVDRRRARSLAMDYLARYPRGFARADAEAILGAP
jgi:hypothetical protein